MPRLPHPLRPARTALVVALLLAVPAAVAAQSKTHGGITGPSVFGPAGSGTLKGVGGGSGGGGGGGGGQYQGPGDGGMGGGGGAGSGGADNGGKSQPKGLPAPNPASPGAPASAPGSTTTPSGAPRGVSAATGDVGESDDTWDSWWETNKFDFIELRRIADAPVTPTGAGNETASARELRLAAVRAHLRDTVLPVLRELTSSPDDAVRGAAAVALAKLHDEESLDRLAQLLGDASLDVRRSALLALGVIDSGRGTWMLLHVAGDSASGRKLLGASTVGLQDRGAALLASSLRGEPASENLLLQLLVDRKGTPAELLALACDAAGLLGSTDSIRPLIDVAFDKDLPEHVRSAATSALGRIGDPSVTPALMELLGLGLEPRRAATLALGEVGHPGATKVIEKLSALVEHDEDAPTRHFAAVSLGRIGGDAARTELLSLLAKGHDDLRPWAALGLGLCERREPSADGAAALLARLPKEANPDTQAAMLVALGLSRADGALPELIKALGSGSSELASSAAMALGLTGQPAARAPLRDVLSVAKDPALLRSAALSLGMLGDSASIPALLNLIRSTSNPFVASFAAIGVAFMGDADAAGPLLDLIQRQGPTGVTTTWAVAAVGQLFDEDRRPALARLASDDNYHVRPSVVAGLLDLGY